VLADLGLEELMRGIFYEVGARIPPRQADRMQMVNGHLWIACPVAVARPLVGSLHTLLTSVLARCARLHARQRYLAAHGDAFRWKAWTAADLCASAEAAVGHDPWCTATPTMPCDCTKRIEQRVLAGAPGALEGKDAERLRP
jgi:hypothetical protein